MDSAAPAFADPRAARIVAFLVEIGIPVEAADLPGPCFVPGIRIAHGRLLVDAARLTYPGELLYAAGHIAVMTPEVRARRSLDGNEADDLGHVEFLEFLAATWPAIAWGWAVLTHLGLDPVLLFHPDAKRGTAAHFADSVASGRIDGLSLLQWMGLTVDPVMARAEGGVPYPHMRRWLRTAPEEVWRETIDKSADIG